MNLIRYFLLGITLTAIILGARFFMKPANSSLALQNEQEKEQALEQKEINLLSRETAQGEVAQPEYAIKSSATRDTPLSTRQQNSSSTSDNTLWSSSDNQDSLPERFLNKGLNPQAINISQGRLKNLKIGDIISLSIPQLAQSYPLDVDQVRKHKNGIRTVSGHLENTDLPYSVIITSGKHASFATINTPDGSYVMEAEGDKGWIMSIANLDYLIDTNLDDFKIPDINR